MSRGHMDFFTASVASLWTTAMRPVVPRRSDGREPAPLADSWRSWHDSWTRRNIDSVESVAPGDLEDEGR
jgi:hypothetical protein